MTEKIIKLPCYGIEIMLTGDGGGSISSDLHEEKNNEDREDNVGITAYNNMIDMLEAIILAHALAGVDIESWVYIEGVESAVQGAANNT